MSALRKALAELLANGERVIPRQANHALSDVGVLRPRLDLSDKFGGVRPIEPGTEADWWDLVKLGGGRQEDVPLSSMFATQESVDDNFADVAARYAKDNAEDLPIVINEQGKNYILDGHHRLTSLWDRGDEAARVLRYDSKWQPGWRGDLETRSNRLRRALMKRLGE